MSPKIRFPCLAVLCLGGCCLQATGPSTGLVGPSSAGATGTAGGNGSGSTAAGVSTGSGGETGSGSTTGTGSGGSTTGRPSCDIDGRLFPSGTFNPADSAQCCNTALNRTAWVPVFRKTLGFPLGSMNGVVDGALGDLNGDGVADMLLVTHTEMESTEEAQAVVFLSGEGGFAAPAVYSTAQNQGGGVALGDLDRDGLPDLIVSTTAALDVFRNAGGGQLEHEMAAYLPSIGCDAVGAPHVLDANNDGWLDVVVATQSCGRLVFANDAKGDGALLPPVQIVGDSGRGRFNFTTLLTVGNFDTNETGYEDLAGGNGMAPHFGLEWFDHNVSGMGFPRGIPDTSFQVVDLGSLPAGSGDAILATDGASLNVYPPGDLGPTAPANYPVEDGGGIIAVGDLNGDGAADVLIASVLVASGASTVDILLNQADGGFGPAGSFVVPGSGAITRVAAGDLDGDGLVDMALVWANGPWEVWVNQCGPAPR